MKRYRVGLWESCNTRYYNPRTDDEYSEDGDCKALTKSFPDSGNATEGYLFVEAAPDWTGNNIYNSDLFNLCLGEADIYVKTYILMLNEVMKLCGLLYILFISILNVIVIY